MLETAANERPAWRSVTSKRPSLARILLDLRLVLILALAIFAGTLAYQAPPTADIAVGWLGDRLFLKASEGHSESDTQSFYGDELTPQASSGRSRWTHQGAAIYLPGLGAGDLDLTVRAQGWPADVLNSATRQPVVSVLAGSTPLGQFVPTSDWADYHVTVPASTRCCADLAIVLLVSDTFTSTQTFNDLRPKGIRIEHIAVRGTGIAQFTPPVIQPVVLLALNGLIWLLALLVLIRRPNLSFVLVIVLLALLAIGLAVARGWAVVLLPWCMAAGLLLLIIALHEHLIDLLVRLIRCYARGDAINYGLTIAAAAWLTLVAARASLALRLPSFSSFRDNFPDSLLYGLLGMSLLLLALVLGRRGLPRIAHAIVQLIGSRRVAPLLMILFCATWIGYQAFVIAGMPYVGHADYADNAVVARNLLAGRGWTVDYVTQFYRLYDGVTRTQETWPLLQPLWIAPFFALFGANDWAAKLPNLVFIALLATIVYGAGARLWDRRVGLTAAIILLTSHLFFKLVIYVTSDLAFVVFAFGAITLLYRALYELPHKPAPSAVPPVRFIARPWLLVGSGVLTGLMLLQKPGSGGLIAVGMGLWFIAQTLGRREGVEEATDTTGRFAKRHSALLYRFSFIVEWGLIALIVVAPLIVRNVLTFGTPYYSTESHDAWVLEYTEWDHIYQVYTTEGGLSELGVPDRSWILRWGFDRALLKIERQFAAVRDYLVPLWSGLPYGLSELLTGRADKERLFFMSGAWLALLGALGAFGRLRRLITLLLAAFVPYILFLAFYWHANEERYFVVIMPWLALFAAYALWRMYDRVAAIGDGRWTPVGLALAVTALVLTIQPSWPKIDEKIRYEPQLYAADLDAYAWLRANTPVNAVMMTRNPWQLNWHSRRPAVMIPYTTDRTELLRLAKYYQVRYLVLDSLQRPEPEVRRLIDAMLEDGSLAFEEEYRTPLYVAEYGGIRREIRAEIFRFPDDYGGVSAIVKR